MIDSKRCYICDRSMYDHDDCDDDKGFGSVSKDILIYDEEDLVDYQDDKGCLKFCHKCDDYFISSKSREDYRLELDRIELKFNKLENNLKNLNEIWNVVSTITDKSATQIKEAFLKKITAKAREYIICLDWLDLPENHVKMKRYFRG